MELLRRALAALSAAAGSGPIAAGSRPPRAPIPSRWRLAAWCCGLATAVAGTPGAEAAAAAEYLPATAAARCTPWPTTAALQPLRARAIGLLGQRGIREPEAWTDAVLVALCAAQLPASAENVSLVFALIERESSFHPHGLLPNAPGAWRKLAYRAIDDLLAAELRDFERLLGREAAGRFVGHAMGALREVGLLDRERLRRSFDRHDERFGWSRRVFTEWDVEHFVARDLLTLADEVTPLGLLLRGALAWEPRWRELLGDGRLFRSVGPLQVQPEAAVDIAAEDHIALDLARARALLYTVQGGVYFGVRQLKPVIAAYTAERALTESSAGFVAADWRQGFVFACRDAALVTQIARLAGRSLPPDTSLSSPPVRALLLSLGATLATPPGASAPGAAGADHAAAVDALLAAAGSPALGQVPLYGRLRAAYRSRFGVEPASAVVPDLQYASAKTGRYRLRDVVDDTRRRFVANCARLGCAG